MNETIKRKRSNNSTISDLDSTLDTTQDTSVYNIDSQQLVEKVEEDKPKKKQNKPKKKQKTSEMASSKELCSLTQKVEEINKHMKNMLTKKDKSFIKDILIDSLDEIKDKIVGAVMKRLEIIEGELHENAIENSKLKKEIQSCKVENETLKEENKQIKTEIEAKIEKNKETVNNLEQYGRRNNIRISGLTHDNKFETSAQSAEGITALLNEYMNLNLATYDIDVAHRLGRHEIGKIRPVIVKFVQREVKFNVMRSAKHLKNTPISVNEDSTQLNQKVLSSIRLNAKHEVAKGWSNEGKLFVKYKTDKIERVKYSDYSKWLALWPNKPEAIDVDAQG